MKTARILIASGLAASAWAVYAKPAPAPAAPKAQDIVAVRQAGMAMSAVTLNTLKSASANAASVKGLSFASGGLARWAASMPALFAPSTKAVASRARPEVWTNQADFAAKAAAFATATKALAAAAQADDKEAFTAALASTGASCKGCHDSYQVPPPPPPKAG